jgi:hypothetical protein
MKARCDVHNTNLRVVRIEGPLEGPTYPVHIDVTICGVDDNCTPKNYVLEQIKD